MKILSGVTEVSAATSRPVSGQKITAKAVIFKAAASNSGGIVLGSSSARRVTNGQTLVITGTDGYNGSYSVLSTTNTTFNIQIAFSANDAKGTWSIAETGESGSISAFASGGTGITTVTGAASLLKPILSASDSISFDMNGAGLFDLSEIDTIATTSDGLLYWWASV